MSSHAISALADLLAGISGQIEHHRAAIAELEQQRSAITTTMSLLDPSYDPANIKARRPATRSQWFEHGEGTRLVLAEFRKAGGGPLTAAQVVERVAAAKGLAFITPGDREKFSDSVENILQRLKKSKDIQSLGRLNGQSSASWQLAPLSSDSPQATQPSAAG